MHMADALLSPAVGAAMTAVSAAAIGCSVKRITADKIDEKKVPMMGVMGAFVFAAQMINFTIPGTGSSGHIGGGILLAALLGPFPALLTLASVLLIQCLFFADGGLLAYGCNVFNIGVCACLLAYPLVYRPIVKRGLSRKSITLAAVLSATLGLQIGAFCVVLQTFASSVTELPFGAFAALMQPIHLAIGLAEGGATAAVLCFVWRARPEILDSAETAPSAPMRNAVIAFLAAALLIGGGLSLFASPHPDGLEWAIEGVSGAAELQGESAAHAAMETVVQSTALMPDYAFSGDAEGSRAGTAAAGIVGSAITLLLAGGIGGITHIMKKKRPLHTDA